MSPGINRGRAMRLSEMLDTGRCMPYSFALSGVITVLQWAMTSSESYAPESLRC